MPLSVQILILSHSKDIGTVEGKSVGGQVTDPSVDFARCLGINLRLVISRHLEGKTVFRSLGLGPESKASLVGLDTRQDTLQKMGIVQVAILGPKINVDKHREK